MPKVYNKKAELASHFSAKYTKKAHNVRK